MLFRNTLGAMAAGVILAACATSGSGLTPASQSAARAFSAAGSAYAFAPYVDMTADPPFEFAEGSKTTGTLYYTMAFIVSYQNKCEGSWGGYYLPNDKTYGPYVREQLANIRKLGGDGILSFGGAGGQELAQTCGDPASLAAAYEQVIDYYGVTHVDFDIEGNGVYDAGEVDRRSQGLALVEEHYRTRNDPLTVSYTLPVLPSGMPDHVVDVLKSALRVHTVVNVVNVMAMDFGDAAPHPKGRMGTYAIEAVTKAAKQLQNIHFPLGANPYASLGVTPMIGVNDVASEIFEPSDAEAVLAWAQTNHLGRIAFWAAQRDKECKGGVNPNASDTCSGILQTPGAFQKIFAAY